MIETKAQLTARILLLIGLLLGQAIMNIPIFAAGTFPCPFGQAALQQQPEHRDLNFEPADPFYNLNGPMYIFPTLALWRSAMDLVVFEGSTPAQIQNVKRKLIAVAPNTCLILLVDDNKDGMSQVRVANGSQVGKPGWVDSAWLHWDSNESYYKALKNAKLVNVHKTTCTSSGQPDLKFPLGLLGEQGVLWDPSEPGRSISVYPTLQAYYAAAELTNPRGAEAAAIQVKAGTCSVIIGSLRESDGFQILNIRILSGTHRGATGFIPQRWLYEPK